MASMANTVLFLYRTCWTRPPLYDRQKAAALLADLEHELRLPRDPVWLGAADGQHERHLRIPGSARRPDSDPVAGRAAHRVDRPADHRPFERPHLEPARAAAAVLPDRRDPELHRTRFDAARFGPLDGGRTALDSRRIHQHQHGAISRLLA